MSSPNVDRLHRDVIRLTQGADFEKALEICQAAIRDWGASDVHYAWHDLAFVLWSSGSKDEAFDAVSYAVALAPDCRSHRLSRALWATGEGKLEMARADWSELIRLEDVTRSEVFLSVALLGRALTSLRRGELAAARDDLARVEAGAEIIVGNRLWAVEDLKRLASF